MEFEVAGENFLHPQIIEFPNIYGVPGIFHSEILRAFGKASELFLDKYYVREFLEDWDILYVLSVILEYDCGPELFVYTAKFIQLKYKYYAWNIRIYVKNDKLRFYRVWDGNNRYDSHNLYPRTKKTMERYGFKCLTQKSYEIYVKGHSRKWWSEWEKKNKSIWRI